MNKISVFMVYSVGHAAVFCAVWYSLRIAFEVQTGIAYDIFGPRGITASWSIYIVIISFPAAIIGTKYRNWLDANISWNIEKQQYCYDPGLENLKARTSVSRGGYKTEFERWLTMKEDELNEIADERWLAILDREKDTNAK